MKPLIEIRKAIPEDATYLPDIEQSAGLTFRTVDKIAWVADEENRSVEQYDQLIRHGLSWVSSTLNEPLVGFLMSEPFEYGLHIIEISVRQEYQRLGHGRALLNHAISQALKHGFREVTLTTFRGVAFNEMYYHRFGFETLVNDRLDSRLSRILEEEESHGLQRETRCAMRLVLPNP